MSQNTKNSLSQFARLSVLPVALAGVLVGAFALPTLRAQSPSGLQGVIDIHAHSDPDTQARRYDALALAKEAKAQGMRAVVLKTHDAPTAQLAYLVNQLVPGFQAWGAIALNRPVGGINPVAVEAQAKVKGNFLKVVFMPTTDAETEQAHATKKPYVSVAKDGVLLPETVEVLKVIAKYDLVLATGHAQPADAVLLTSEAAKLGVKRVVVTHPATTGTSLAQMQEEAKNGAYLEFTGNPIIPGNQNGSATVIPNAPGRKPEEWAADIKAIGPQHIIMSGDLGGTAYPPFVEGWKLYIAALKGAGVSDADIHMMSVENPAHLLGMDAAK